MFRLFFGFLIVVFLSGVLSLGVAGYFIWEKNPYNVRSCLVENYMKASSTEAIKTASEKATTTNTENSDKPVFSLAQENMLSKAGIEPESISSEMLIQKEACFIEKLGEQRVKEIKAGDIPNPMEIYKAKSCF